MQLQEIYIKYKTLPNLQLHMLRVSAVARIILDNWIGENVDKQAIIKACLLHDIAKPITFDMSKQRYYAKNDQELEEIEYCHNFLLSNYGKEEYPALQKIGKEINLNSKTLELLSDLDWQYIKNFLDKDKTESLIPIYCDMRISPEGIVTINHRLQDLKNRTEKENKHQYVDGGNLEAVIKKNTNMDLSSITDQQIEEIISKLRIYEF